MDVVDRYVCLYRDGTFFPNKLVFTVHEIYDSLLTFESFDDAGILA